MRRAAGHADRRRQGGLRQQGDVARAQARHARLGAHVRRHGALRRRERGHALGRAHDLAEDRAGDRVQDEGVARRRHHGAAAALEAVEWLALGFEIIDCLYADWKYQPADFVAAYGLHAALIVGEPRPVTAASISELVEQLPTFKVRLSKDGQLVEEGSGRNSLRSPALCLAELASAMAKQDGAEPLAAGDLVSSGTLTESTPIQPGATWTASVEGIDLPTLTLTLV